MRIVNVVLILSVLISLSCTEDLGPGKFANVTGQGGGGGEIPGPTPTPVRPTPTPISQWRNKSSYQFETGSEAGGNGMAVDDQSNLYSVGYGVRNEIRGGVTVGVKYWLVRKSINRGATWTVVDEYNGEAGLDSVAVAVATSGNFVYVVGTATVNAAAPNYYWAIRRSSDNGATWITVDSITGAAGQPAEATAVAIGAGGRVIVTGTTHDGTKAEWPIRVSTDNGGTWTTTSTYQTTGNARGNAVTVDGNGVIFAGGSGTDTNGKLNWLVAKSTDNGANWSQIDNWQLDSGYDSELRALAVDQRNRVYGAGFGMNATGRHWIVRRGITGTDTFSIADDYVFPSDSRQSANGTAKAITFDSRNFMYVAGYASTNVNGMQRTIAVIRKSTTNGVNFTTDDSYQPLANSTNASNNGMVIDSDNRMHTTGTADMNGPTWLIRGNP